MSAVGRITLRLPRVYPRLLTAPSTLLLAKRALRSRAPAPQQLDRVEPSIRRIIEGQ